MGSEMCIRDRYDTAVNDDIVQKISCTNCKLFVPKNVIAVLQGLTCIHMAKRG